MRWPFKNNRFSNDDGDDWVTKAVPISTLARWYMYDMDVEDTNKLAVSLDLTPVSPEGDEKERQDSDVRVEHISPLMPFFYTLADINANVVLNVQKANLPEEMRGVFDGSPEELHHLYNFYRSMSFAAILSSFSSAAELGLIDLSGRFVTNDAE